MNTPATPSDPNQAEIPRSSEEALRLAWDRYGNYFYVLCGVIALGILAKGGWDYLNAQKELGIKAEFAECTTQDAFRTFVGRHPGHVLTGVAELTLANGSYAGGNFADAVTSYRSAVGDLPAGPFQSNAKMGLAMALAQMGKQPEAEADLQQLLGDTTVLKTTRCEAGYHLAELAVSDGRGADVQRIAEQVMQIDPSNPYAQRTFTLRAPVSTALSIPGLPSLTAPARP
jgi:hypothetical protein